MSLDNKPRTTMSLSSDEDEESDDLPRPRSLAASTRPSQLSRRRRAASRPTPVPKPPQQQRKRKRVVAADPEPETCTAVGVCFSEVGVADEDKKPHKWRVNRKWFALTFPCPVAEENNPIGARAAIYNQLNQRFRTNRVEWCHVAKELHKNGKDHYHASVNFKKPVNSTNPLVFDVLGVHANLARAKKKKKGKGKTGKGGKTMRMKKSHWSRYILKTDTNIYSKGQNLEDLRQGQRAAKSSVSRVTNYIWEIKDDAQPAKKKKKDDLELFSDDDS